MAAEKNIFTFKIAVEDVLAVEVVDCEADLYEHAKDVRLPYCLRA